MREHLIIRLCFESVLYVKGFTYSRQKCKFYCSIQLLSREKGENAIYSGQIIMVSGVFRYTQMQRIRTTYLRLICIYTKITSVEFLLIYTNFTQTSPQNGNVTPHPSVMILRISNKTLCILIGKVDRQSKTMHKHINQTRH